MLDTLTPPSPGELVADCRQVGAQAVGRYWWRPWPGSTWTLDHDAALAWAGIQILYIVVPGDNPPSPLVTCEGLRGVPVVADLEPSSLPAREWVDQFCAFVSWVQHGRALRYGDLGDLAGYPACEGDWISHGLGPIQAGVFEPVPPLPQWPGTVAWQYAVQVQINGHDYDASVVDLSIFPGFGGDDMFEDSDRARLADKVYGFELGAEKVRYIAGPDQNTYFNLVSQGPDGKTTTVRVFAYDAAGAVLGVKDYRTTGNQPNVAGPQQAAGQASELGATGAGVTLGFVSQGPDDVMVTIH